ncbi:MAG: hypothetical protein M3Q57_09410, partial [Pseudomonadota bacterium]|nr:hypothetical protein [Pseudomonadota bacterium]
MRRALPVTKVQPVSSGDEHDTTADGRAACPHRFVCPGIDEVSRALRLLAAHWYAPAFLAIVTAVWMLARSPMFMKAGGETALLLDLCLTAPFLYLLCYARKQPLRVSLIRALAIACGGIWLASWLIPTGEQLLLPQLTPLRWVGLILVGLIEIRLLIAAIRFAFSSTGSAEDVVAASGAPAWIARLMLLEARFWRGLWRLIRRR